jgi:hypothetical protein
MDYGREFDFSRPFFEQFAELGRVVPRFSLYNMNPVNSEYVNFSLNSKNCYMCFSTVENEDCMYSANIDKSRDCVDCTYTRDQSELCYGCLDITACYRCLYVQNSASCADCFFCYNCTNCDHCFGSVNLRGASYYWFNEKVTPEEYDRRLAQSQMGSASSVTRMKQKFLDHLKKFPRKYASVTASEESTGDHLDHDARCVSCFDVRNAEDCSYVTRAFDIKDCYDSYGFLGAELVYEVVSSGSGSNLRFSLLNYWNNAISYCEQCYNSENLFGCIGLNKKKHCILNKQHTKEEYDVRVKKIIAHMKETGEYGEFFPIALSPFGYNETIAQENYPLTKDDVLARGWRWQDELQRTSGKETVESDEIPDDIANVSDNVLGWVFACTTCARNFKIIKQELAFYKKLSIPIPRLCQDCRYAERMALRPPRKLVARQCKCTGDAHDHGDTCSVIVQTVYPESSGITLYCESCYQKELV